MFPTSKNPFPYNSSPETTTTTLLKRPFPWDHQNPSFTQQEESPFFLHYFPSPFLDEDHETHFTQLFSQEDQLGASIEGEGKEEKSGKKKNMVGSAPRRRTGKKDRHSKICTAQGLRDRRMRLSLQIARKFFDLQDMLGFDKASNTIEWLLSNSKTAIKELTASKTNRSSSEEGNKSESLISECEGVSSMEENSNNVEVSKGKNVIKQKESREKARARARERTKEKMMMNKTQITNEHSNNYPTPTILDQESNSNNTQENNSPNERGLETHFANVEISEKYFGVASSTEAAPMFEYHHHHDLSSSVAMDSTSCSNSFMGFLGNWELATFSGNPNGSIYLGDTGLDFQPVDQEKHFSCKQY